MDRNRDAATSGSPHTAPNPQPQPDQRPPLPHRTPGEHYPPHTTDPTLLAEIAAELDAMTDQQARQVEAELAGIGRGMDDELAEITQYHYEPGALRDYARAHSTDRAPAPEPCS